jgi:hypothetical protein
MKLSGNKNSGLNNGILLKTLLQKCTCQTMPDSVSELWTNTYGNHLNNKQYMLIMKRTQIAAATELFIMTFVEHQFSEPYQKLEFQTFICATAS